jgi:hypothetical protein
MAWCSVKAQGQLYHTFTYLLVTALPNYDASNTVFVALELCAVGKEA